MRRSLVALVAGLALVLGIAPAAQAGPGGPENVSVKLTYSDDNAQVYAYLTWDPPVAGAATSYEFYVEGSDAYTVATSDLHYGRLWDVPVWDEVKPAIRVRAIDDTGAGPGSPIASTTLGQAPGPVQNLAVTVGNNNLNVAWSAPQNPGETPTSYVVIAESLDKSVANFCHTTLPLTCLVTVQPGVPRTVRVIPVDVHGVGGQPAYAPGTYTAGQVPQPPKAVKASAVATVATVTWKAPINTGGLPITTYRVAASNSGGGCETATLSCKVKGLKDGKTYTFTVKAVNMKGESTASAPSNPITAHKLVPHANVKVPAQIKPTGRTVLLKRPVRTDAGDATPRVSIKPASAGTAHIRKSGKVAVVTKGVPATVTLRLSTPPTKRYRQFAFKKVWRVS